MANNAVVIPVAVLAAICVVMFAFVCWWFPRTWSKGNAQERAEWEERKRQRELAEDTAVASEDVDVELADGNRVPKISQAQRTYVPPPVTSY